MLTKCSHPLFLIAGDLVTMLSPFSWSCHQHQNPYQYGTNTKEFNQKIKNDRFSLNVRKYVLELLELKFSYWTIWPTHCNGLSVMFSSFFELYNDTFSPLGIYHWRASNWLLINFGTFIKVEFYRAVQTPRPDVICPEFRLQICPRTDILSWTIHFVGEKRTKFFPSWKTVARGGPVRMRKASVWSPVDLRWIICYIG